MYQSRALSNARHGPRQMVICWVFFTTQEKFVRMARLGIRFGQSETCFLQLVVLLELLIQSLANKNTALHH
jgi:hypothetical protein